MPEANNTDVEVWKPIPSEPGYESSSLGRYRTVDRIVQMRRKGKMLRGYVNSLTGYLEIYCNGRKRTAHSLTLEAFSGPRPEGADACHNDGSRTNNRPDNLRWDTRSNNQQDKRRHGTYYDANNCLNETQARIIRRLFESRRLTSQRIADLFGVSIGTIRRIKEGETWRSLGPPISGHGVRKLGADEIARIKKMRDEGMKLLDVALQLGVSKSSVFSAIQRDDYNETTVRQ